MPWQFCSSTGAVYQNGKLLWFGYSGHDFGKNNPDFEAQRDVGPIPSGRWLICGPPFDTASHGPYVMRLEPATGTETHQRSGFLVHGDSTEHPGQASMGCIILPRPARMAIWQSGDRELQVLRYPPQ